MLCNRGREMPNILLKNFTRGTPPSNFLFHFISSFNFLPFDLSTVVEKSFTLTILPLCVEDLNAYWLEFHSFTYCVKV